MTTQTLVPRIREWREGENLDSLANGEIIRMHCVRNYIDGDFIGLYQGKQNNKYVLLSRGMEKNAFPLDPERILRWKLSGEGNVDDFGDGPRFYFDGNKEEKGFIEQIDDKDSKEYQRLNIQLAKIEL